MKFLYFKEIHSHLHNSKASISQITRKRHWLGDGTKAPAVLYTMSCIERRRRSLSVTTEAFTDSHSGSSTAAEGGSRLRGSSRCLWVYSCRMYMSYCKFDVLSCTYHDGAKQHPGRQNGDMLALRQSLTVSHTALQLMILLPQSLGLCDYRTALLHLIESCFLAHK